MKKLKVLIVDDSSVMRKIVERALRQAGLELTEVLEASNGAECTRKSGRQRASIGSASGKETVCGFLNTPFTRYS